MTQTAPTSAARRHTLSREQVAAAALELIDRHGLEALTMRGLARELGIGTMTVYGYFRSKEELLDAIVEIAVAEHSPRLKPGTWRERVGAAVLAMYRGLAAHPGIVELRMRRPIWTPGAFVFTEEIMAALTAAGFDRARAAQAFRTVFVYAFGSAAFHPARLDDELRRQSTSTVMQLPPDRYPTVLAAVDELAGTLQGEEQFVAGLDCILDGLERELGGE